MDRIKAYLASGGALSLLLFALFQFLHTEAYFGTLSNFIIIILAFLCAGMLYLSFRALRGKDHEASEAFAFLLLAVLLWAFAEGIWFYYASIAGEESPYPSLADLFWLLGYIPFTYSLFLFFRSIKFQSKAALIAVGVYIVFGAALGYLLREAVIDSEAEALANVISIAYVLGDLILLSLAFPLIIAFFTRVAGISWLVIGLSLLLIFIADIWFLLLTAAEEYSDSHILNLFYMLSYIWLGAGALINVAERRKAG